MQKYKKVLEFQGFKVSVFQAFRSTRLILKHYNIATPKHCDIFTL